jgi:putative Mg2+ transporter-C (MgtC) family protein
MSMMGIYRMVSEYLSDFGIGQITIRAILAIIVGCLIGAERAKHGRAAGMRTHILVCLGAAMTSMTSLYVSEVLNYGGDVLRIPAQVISGIGFLGAGMIILKNNNTIVGLTTAAGIWATATIGIAIGYGFEHKNTPTGFLYSYSRIEKKINRPRKDFGRYL